MHSEMGRESELKSLTWCKVFVNRPYANYMLRSSIQIVVEPEMQLAGREHRVLLIDT
jgi:hypothetical protein